MNQQHETLEYFGLTNDIIFGWIMKNDELCLAIIRAILLDLNIIGIAYKKPQYEISHVTPCTIPLEVDTFKNESVAFGGIFVCQRIQRSKNFNY